MKNTIFDLSIQCGGILAEPHSKGFSTKSKIYGSPVILETKELSISLGVRPKVSRSKVSKYDGIFRSFSTITLAIHHSATYNRLTKRNYDLHDLFRDLLLRVSVVFTKTQISNKTGWGNLLTVIDRLMANDRRQIE